MSERPTYTLHLAAARDTKAAFGRRAAWSYGLYGPEGEEVHAASSDPDNPPYAAEGDPNFTAMLDLLPSVPKGVRLRIVTADQYLYEAKQYVGIFNGTPQERVAAHYRKGKKRKEEYANLHQLRPLDALLSERFIATVGTRPETDAEAQRHGLVIGRVRDLLAFDPDHPNGY